MKEEHYVKVQRRKSLKYNDKQHYQYYVTIPIEILCSLALKTGQVMRCTTNGKGILVYSKAEKKKNNKIDYKQWISIIKKFTPPTNKPGKTYQQIRREGNIPLRSAPALWVRQAETDIGLIRKLNSKTRRILWTISQHQDSDKQFMEPTLIELIEDS
jgi:bifunctional DNA-binding transcriptional regulator/antitoxin component of YhaV-PrlF toxin-antitoxin module